MSADLKNELFYDQTRLAQHEQRLVRAGLSRREVLQAMLALGVSASVLGSRRVFAQTSEPTIVKPTPDTQFRTLGSNRETLFEAFKGSGYLTPASLFFVRNHTRTPRIEAASWRLRVEGPGVTRPLSLSYDDLLELPSVRRTRFIECAGNGRSFFDTQQGTPAPGSQWRLGAIGVAEWTGVRLSELLERAGLKPSAVDVMPEGLDDVVGNDGHVRRPLSIEKALDDVLVVYGMNGEILPPDHGFPARLLVPGWIGIANIKWLGSLYVAEEPLFSAWNTTQYRLAGDAYPDNPVLTTQGVKSAFELPFPATLSSGWQLLTGRAWSASGSIRKVEVSFHDDGPWWPAWLHDRLHHGNVAQAWVQWSIPWLARRGARTLRARATDSAGNVQPLSVPFNTNGYLFSSVVRHPVTVT
jgi:sulfane dehydrogenase subunit SoxC